MPKEAGYTFEMMKPNITRIQVLTEFKSHRTIVPKKNCQLKLIDLAEIKALESLHITAN